MMRFLFAIVFFPFLLQPPQEKKSLFINELMARNINVLPGELWRFDDWVEIYNAGNERVDMAGMYFSDDEKNSQKWQIPSGQPELTTIQPKGYLIFWFDKLTYLNERHVNFKLSGNGETVFLFDKDGRILIDSLRFEEQYPDVSFGRWTDGSSDLTYFTLPTPGAENSGQEKLSKNLEQPVFVPSGGFYDKKVKVKIGNGSDKSVRIYYTTDGSEPTQNDMEYKSPVELTATVVLKARAFKKGLIPSNVETFTYFIIEPTHLPVVSISCDPEKLWDKKTGLYNANLSEIERGAFVEYFDRDRTKGFRKAMGLKLTGRYSMGFPKKSFMLNCRGKYSEGKIEYPLFADKDIEKFDGIILRSDPTASKTQYPKLTGERVKNELIYQINQQMGGRVDMQAYQPSVLFINGKYWGLYNIMERKDENFVFENYGIKDIDMINGDNMEIIAGDAKQYNAMLDYMNENDIRIDSVYKRVESMMDMQNFIDYRIQEIYYASNDPDLNIRFWRPRTEDGKWRWLNFDHDSWGEHSDTTLRIHSEDTIASGVHLLGRLLQNLEFRDAFINRLADCLNTVFRPQNIHRLIDKITAVIADDKMRDRERWESEMPFVPVNSQIEWVKDFADKRPERLRDEILTKFNLDGISRVELQTNGSNFGKIQINSISVDSFPWKGIYYKGVPITITAVPNPGYQFKKWFGASKDNSATIQLNLKGDIFLSAEFELKQD